MAVPPLSAALRDPHPDVRKAALIALAPVSGHQAAADALRAATADSDADVRAYAARVRVVGARVVMPGSGDGGAAGNFHHLFMARGRTQR